MLCGSGEKEDTEHFLLSCEEFEGLRERIWGEIKVALDEAVDEGHAWRSVCDQEDDGGKALLLLVSGVSSGLPRKWRRS